VAIKQKPKPWLPVSLFFLAISLIFNFLFIQKIKTNNQGMLVLEVLDGDTLLLEGDVRFRLRNIDAPELKFCGGPQAKTELEKMVKGKKIVIREQILDTWGRPMGLVYANGKLINEEMLKTGWTRYHTDNNSKKEALKSAYEKAKSQRIGIYSPLCWQTENTNNPKCLIKGNIDKNSDRRNYYFPGCAQYDFTIVEKDIGENWFCTEIEAQKAGFEKSKTCFDKKF